MVSRGHALCVISHQVRYDGADAPLFVVQHYGRATRRAGAQLERPVGVLVVEWLAVQSVKVFDLEFTVLEEGDVRGVLSGNAFAD